MNRFFKLIFLIVEGFFCYILVSGILSVDCVFQKYFHFACPACGFTRAFREIFHLHLIEALQYNLLSIPLFLMIIIIDSYLIYDILLNKQKTEKILEQLSRYIVPILILLGINTIINNIRGI